MSDQNTAHTATGLARMLDQFQGTDVQTLAGTFLDQCQALENAVWPLLGERSIDNATGHRLDGIGQILGLTRSGRTDAVYRAALKTEQAVLQSDGTAEALIELAQLLVVMGTADYEVREYYPKSFYIRPVDHAITVDPVFVGSQMKRAVPAATLMSFIYSRLDDADTFTLSSQGAVVETSAALGLAAVPSSIGGWGWEYDANNYDGAGLADGIFRFDSSTITSASQVFMSNNDLGSNDFASTIAGFAEIGSLQFTFGASVGIFCPVLSVSAQSGYHIINIARPTVAGAPADGNGFTVKFAEDGGHLSGVAPE